MAHVCALGTVVLLCTHSTLENGRFDLVHSVTDEQRGMQRVLESSWISHVVSPRTHKPTENAKIAPIPNTDARG
jgi:hypothetical protein